MGNNECVRAFHRSSKAYYAKAMPNENVKVMFGMYLKGDGTDGEMEMEWIELQGKLVPRLKCFEDSWEQLASFSDLIESLGKIDGDCIQEEEFCLLLKKHGFQDFTSYKDPYEDAVNNEEMVSVEIPKKQAVELGFING